ncbi:MAG: hypothetical protein JNJ95_01965 [Dechloromonas sp.]|nr:hypothetical protein [Dechloromonas sp.]
MPNKNAHHTPVSTFMRQVSLSILMPFFSKAKEENSSPPTFTTSNFSRPDQSELLAHEEEICPLVEAEVYVIYGKVADANEALAAGVKSGRITAAQVAQFWSSQGKAPDGKAAG